MPALPVENEARSVHVDIATGEQGEEVAVILPEVSTNSGETMIELVLVMSDPQQLGPSGNLGPGVTSQGRSRLMATLTFIY